MSHKTIKSRSHILFGRLLIGIALLLAASRSQAAFQYAQAGVRSMSLAGASIPAQADSTAMFQNAAGVSGLERGEAYMMYTKLYAGQSGIGSIGQSFVTAGVPTRWGSIGVGLSDFKAAGLLNERVLGVSFARRIFANVDAGVTAKYMHHKYAPGSDQSGVGDPVFANGTARGAVAFDAGIIAGLSKSLKAGFAARSINSPDIGLDSEDRVPREYQAALSYDKADWQLKTTVDVVYRDNRVGELRDRATPSIGFEKAFGDERVKFRAGMSLHQFSAGVGMQFDRFGFDYGFVLSRNLIASSAGTHVIGIRYRFGGK